MTGWDSLLSAALVGTERRPFELDTLPGVPADQLAADGAEARLLAAAAVLATYRRAGWTSGSRRVAMCPPARPDHRPECSETAAQLLELLLAGDVRIDGGNEVLVRHWLAACRAAGQRVPARLVVSLLHLATMAPTARQPVADVTGPRGAWLAAQNPQWSWAAGQPTARGDIVDRFATATRADRLALLTTVRSTDPEFGRELVESTWTSEQAVSRAGLLDALGTGLSEADEPLLESALDDRAASVRAAASALLDRLPGSRRAARMADRARPLVQVDGRAGIVVELPGEPDLAARRDGISDQREPGQGLRASWLIQLLAATPLPVWESSLGLAPAGAAGLAAGHAELTAGWARAAVHQENQAWAAALAAHNPTPRLLSVLPPATATGIVAGYPRMDTPLANLLTACPGPWSAAFSTATIQRLRSAKGARALVNATLPAMARHLHPAVLPDIEAWIAAVPDEQPLRRALRGLAHALTIRHTINQEFA